MRPPAVFQFPSQNSESFVNTRRRQTPQLELEMSLVHWVKPYSTTLSDPLSSELPTAYKFCDPRVSSASWLHKFTSVSLNDIMEYWLKLFGEQIPRPCKSRWPKKFSFPYLNKHFSYYMVAPLLFEQRFWISLLALATQLRQSAYETLRRQRASPYTSYGPWPLTPGPKTETCIGWCFVWKIPCELS
jgi:hypothetical protein